MEEKERINSYLTQFFPMFDTALKKFLSENGELRVFEEEIFLMRPGQYIKSIMLIVKGRVKVYRENREGHEFFMYDISGGQACALSVVCGSKNSVSEILAKTIEKTEALFIPIQLMDVLNKRFSNWYQFVLETYSVRFAELLMTIDQIAFKRLDERLENYLHHEYEKTGFRLLNLTHVQIAGDLNSTREVISRLLKKMEQQGALELRRNAIYWNR